MTLHESFVPDHLRPRPVDSDGFELPPWDNPWFAIPDQADVAWLNETPPPITGGAPVPFEPTDADWDEWAAASYGFGDEDLAVSAGLPVG